MSYYISFDRESSGEPKHILIIKVLFYKKFYFKYSYFQRAKNSTLKLEW